MEFIDVINNRRSIREYLSDDIPMDTLSNLANAVYTAPSACNRQPYQMIIVRNGDQKEQLCECLKQEFFVSAPAIACLVGNSEQAWVRNLDHHSFLDIDLGIVAGQFMLAAVDEGLSTCCVASFDSEEINRVLNISAPWTTRLLFPLGYAAKAPGVFFRDKTPEQLFEVR